MKTLQIILIALAGLTSCTKKTELAASSTSTTTTTATTMPDSNIYTYLALGDSYTIGEAVPSDESYPVQLASGLTGQQLYVQTPTIIATTGWTTSNLISAIAQNPISRNGARYSFVTLLIGVPGRRTKPVSNQFCTTTAYGH